MSESEKIDPSIKAHHLTEKIYNPAVNNENKFPFQIIYLSSLFYKQLHIFKNPFFLDLSIILILVQYFKWIMFIDKVSAKMAVVLFTVKPFTLLRAFHFAQNVIIYVFQMLLDSRSISIESCWWTLQISLSPVNHSARNSRLLRIIWEIKILDKF